MNIMIVFFIIVLITIEFLLIRFFWQKNSKAKPAVRMNIGELSSGQTERFTVLTGSELEKKIWLEEGMSFLVNLSERILLCRNKDLIAREMVEDTCAFFNTEIGVLHLVDKRSQVLRVKYAKGISKDLIERSSLKKEEGISGLSWANNELFADDLNKNDWLKSINRESYFNNSCFISVPLSARKEIVGVLNLSGKRNNIPFKKEEVMLISSVARVASISFQNLLLFEEVEKSYLNSISTLAITLDARDHYTKKHSENVTKYSLAIAKEINLPSEKMEFIKYAGLLHDIGKIGIRDDVLLKEGKLTQEEFEQIKTHPLKGEVIVKPLAFLKDVPTLIRHHHERYDGRGYPDGLIEDNIELGARILAVADTFDAMTTDRPYRKGLSKEEALAELIRSRGAQFDPEVVDSFIKILQDNPGIIKENFSSEFS